jgi:protein-tyrosine-phosphatase
MAILFTCAHGGAKSVIAASYFNRLANGEVATAASSEEPYDAVPEPVAEFLEREGFDVRGYVPHRATGEERQRATRVIDIEQWGDVPKASEDLEGSVAAIRRRVEELVKELRE